MRRLGSAWLAALTLAALVSIDADAAAADEVEDLIAATSHTPDQYLATFDNAELPGLGEIGPAPTIMGNAALDARIRAIGEARGYQRRPEPNRQLVAVNGVRLQADAAAAWESLQAAARAAGHSIWITSGHRSVATQISIFRRRLSGTSDAAIDRRLQTVAVPGYSKHHTGYAIDIRSSGGGGFAFRNTAAYAWLAADDFANAKAHGWIPSYPEGSGPAGPVPEPWEFVWVGGVNILCGDYEPTPERPFCDSIGAAFEADIMWMYEAGITSGCRAGRFCTERVLERWEGAALIWRSAGSPAATVDLPFVDLSSAALYSDPVRWMYENAITTGTGATEFSPQRTLTRAEFVTFVWRFAGQPDPVGEHAVFEDVDSSRFAADAIEWASSVGVTSGTSPTTFTPARAVTRSEVAAFLHRYDALSSAGYVSVPSSATATSLAQA